jgi:putative transposase
VPPALWFIVVCSLTDMIPYGIMGCKMNAEVIKIGRGKKDSGPDTKAIPRDARVPEGDSDDGRQVNHERNSTAAEVVGGQGERVCRRAYVYKLKPNAAQRERLSATLETCRRLYNDCLFERQACWEQHPDEDPAEKRVTGSMQKKSHVTDRRKSDEFLLSVNSQILQDVVDRLEKTFKAFFKRVKQGQTPGYPRFKGRGWYDSFTYPRFGWDASQIKASETEKPSRYGKVCCAGIGWIKMFYDRPIQGKAKTVTFRRRTGGWYAIISCEVPYDPMAATGESVGIDLGIEAFATLSNGERIENPRILKKRMSRMKRASRRLSRRDGPDRKKGKFASSGRWKKARALLAKQHDGVRRTRQEFHRRTVHALVSRFDAIAVEDLNVRGLVRNHHLARAISDVGWASFVMCLVNKAESAGRVVTKVNPAYTSQDCSECGARVPKKLSERMHCCPYCGVVMHRDENAARNIKERAKSLAFGEVEAVAPAREPRTTHMRVDRGQLLLSLFPDG